MKPLPIWSMHSSYHLQVLPFFEGNHYGKSVRLRLMNELQAMGGSNRKKSQFMTSRSWSAVFKGQLLVSFPTMVTFRGLGSRSWTTAMCGVSSCTCHFGLHELSQLNLEFYHQIWGFINCRISHWLCSLHDWSYFLSGSTVHYENL